MPVDPPEPGRSWYAPSVVAACAGSLAAGAWLARALGLTVNGAAAAGFVALVGVPLLLVLGIIARGVGAEWRVAELPGAAARGRAELPVALGWMIAVALAVITFGWWVFRGTWVLASLTQFKPKVLALAQPMIGVLGAIVLIVATPVAADLVTRAFARLHARRRRAEKPVRLTPRRLAVLVAVVGIAGVWTIWRFIIAPRVLPAALHSELALAPAAPAIAPLLAVATMIAVHAIWRRGGRRVLAIGFGGGALASVVLALVTGLARPAAALAIWADAPGPGAVLGALFDTERLREAMPMAPFAPVARGTEVHPDVVIVTLDAFRPDRLSPYGGEATTPVLRDLAARGAVFRWAFAASSSTAYSVPAMLVGTSPDRLRGVRTEAALQLDPRHVTLAERLRAAGYETAAFTCSPELYSAAARTGLARGFSTVSIAPTSALAVERAVAFLANRPAGQKPLLLYVHLVEPRLWGSIGADEINARDAYDRALAATDPMLGQLVASFANRPRSRQPLLVVTGTHGEGLGDHGQRTHGTDLYNSQIHVPLLLVGPALPSRVLTETASLVDLVPTVIDLAGYVPPTGPRIDGRSLAPLVRAAVDPPPSAQSTAFAMIDGPKPAVAIIEDKWKLIQTGSVDDLFEIHGDPDERTNVLRSQLEVSRRLRALLAARRLRATLPPF